MCYLAVSDPKKGRTVDNLPESARGRKPFLEHKRNRERWACSQLAPHCIRLPTLWYERLPQVIGVLKIFHRVNGTNAYAISQPRASDLGSVANRRPQPEGHPTGTPRNLPKAKTESYHGNDMPNDTKAKRLSRRRCGCSFGFYSIALLSSLVSGYSADTSSTNHFRLSDVIPTGKTTVELLEVRFSERVEELARRWSSAVATNREWWMEYVKKHADERPLPYHTNLGISEQEYTEYLEGADKSRHLRKVSDAYVTFKREGNLLSIDIGDASSPVEKWKLNLSTGDLLTPAGDAGKPVWKNSDDATQPLGAYEGYSWNFEKSDATMSNARTASLWVYRLKANGMIFWRIQDGEMRHNRSVRHLDLMFRYDPKQHKP